MNENYISFLSHGNSAHNSIRTETTDTDTRYSAHDILHNISIVFTEYCGLYNDLFTEYTVHCLAAQL